jgi:2-(1,2-epoxy-1,2-dihydrophenyl)acetyl-CoA isomerase
MKTQYKTLLFSITDQIATITLNRPDNANGMSMELIEDLTAAASICQEEVEAARVRVVILTGTGKIFCAGGDIHSFASFGDEVAEAIGRLAGHLHDATSLFMRMNVPVITAINGAAAGAGFSLAMMGDLVIAGHNANFTMAYTAIGLSPDGAATYTLPRLVGIRRAQELMYLNRRLSAEEALQWGLVTKVVDDDQLMNEVNAIAKKLASGPTRAFATVKMLLNEGAQNTPEQQMALEGKNLSALSASVDGREGIRAFLDKRKPVFTGK